MRYTLAVLALVALVAPGCGPGRARGGGGEGGGSGWGDPDAGIEDADGGEAPPCGECQAATWCPEGGECVERVVWSWCPVDAVAGQCTCRRFGSLEPLTYGCQAPDECPWSPDGAPGRWEQEPAECLPLR